MRISLRHFVFGVAVAVSGTVISAMIIYAFTTLRGPDAKETERELPSLPATEVARAQSLEWSDDFSDGTIDLARWKLGDYPEPPYERDGVLNFVVPSLKSSETYKAITARTSGNIEEASVTLMLQSAQIDSRTGQVALGATLKDGRYITADLRVGPDGAGTVIHLCKDDYSGGCDDVKNSPTVQKDEIGPVDIKITYDGSEAKIYINGDISYQIETPGIDEVDLHLWAETESVFHITADNFFVKYRS
jgi:hypothetical protein